MLVAVSVAQPSGGDLDDGLPSRAAGITPRLQQIAQFADVLRCTAVLQAEVGQAALSTSFGGAGKQVIHIIGAQGDGLRRTKFLCVLHGWISKMQKARTGCLQAGVNKGLCFRRSGRP